MVRKRPNQYTAEKIGSHEPDPASFEYLLKAEEESGYTQEEILHVGQSLSTIMCRLPRPVMPHAGYHDILSLETAAQPNRQQPAQRWISTSRHLPS